MRWWSSTCQRHQYLTTSHQDPLSLRGVDHSLGHLFTIPSALEVICKSLQVSRSCCFSTSHCHIEWSCNVWWKWPIANEAYVFCRLALHIGSWGVWCTGINSGNFQQGMTQIVGEIVNLSIFDGKWNIVKLKHNLIVYLICSSYLEGCDDDHYFH